MRLFFGGKEADAPVQRAFGGDVLFGVGIELARRSGHRSQ